MFNQAAMNEQCTFEHSGSAAPSTPSVSGDPDGVLANIFRESSGDGPHGPGVRYACQRCTACCRWPGDVILTDEDVARISRFLGLSEWDFIQRHTRLSRNRRHLSLHEVDDGACAFLDGGDCRLQPVKPAQCAGFPNRWVFPGWQQVCEALPLAVPVAVATTGQGDAVSEPPR